MIIGMSASLVEDIENCVFSGFVLRARPVNKKLDNLYKSYCFSIEPVRKEIVTKSFIYHPRINKWSIVKQGLLFLSKRSTRTT